ncbi:hypothetical protein FRC05_007011 [Tulasnella sp. 425]|nr:hypothetical protein FRC05_007011 [Tulasnella sp. 425]
MNTEKPRPDPEERLIQYRLSPDELRDPSKLKFKLMSMEAVFALGQLAAAASGVPGLGAAVMALEGVVNSVDRVKSHRKRCRHLKNSWVNLVNLVHKNKGVMKESELIQLLDNVVETLDEFLKSIKEWSELSRWKTWMYRHDILERLERFQMAFDEACRLVSELVEARENNSVAKETRLQNALREIRMDKTLDISTLPADLSIEVSLLHPQVDEGRRYQIALGMWLGTDIVALKFPLDFKVLKCQNNCRGSKTICPDQFRHVKAAAAMKIRDIARGLIHIHGKDVVHGSLSPTNVLIEGKGATVTPLIGDFSVSKIIPPNEMVAVTDMRDDRMMIRFQAPELILGESGPGITAEADVFAWGMTSLEIISGVMPYNKEIDYGPLHARTFTRRERPTRAEHPSPLWESCPGLWDLLAACWNDACDHRPCLNDILTKLDSWIKVHEVDQ